MNRASDFPRSWKTDGIRFETGLHISHGNVILHVQIHLSHSFFINFNLYLVDRGKCATLTVLITAYAVSTCDRSIFPFRKSFEITIFSHFDFRQLFPLYQLGLKYALDRLRYNDACAHSNCAEGCRN